MATTHYQPLSVTITRTAASAPPPAHRLLQAANGGEQITRIRNGATRDQIRAQVDHNGGSLRGHVKNRVTLREETSMILWLSDSGVRGR